MCGIAGLFSDKVDLDRARFIVKQMTDAIEHRGPDGEGIWQGDDPITIGHRRLKIIDLSDEGKQPMASSYGRYIISFNGEIYNFLELKQKLVAKDYGFRGLSDTEVLVNMIEVFGFESALEQIVGMFAIAVWDRKERELLLARDRIGEKPLYYTEHGERFLFGSELKSFFALDGWRPSISKSALSQFMTYSYVPAPQTIFEGVYKLEPAHYLRVSLPMGGKFRISKKKYWNLHQFSDVDRRVDRDERNLLDELESQLTRSVSNQMISDVPLGAFLSGGIDSTLIVSLMQKLSSSPVKTFTVGYEESDYNESQYASKVAHFLGTEHTDLKVTSSDVMNLIPNIPSIYDEPFADSSQLPTTLISQLTRQHVTVSLSGDGGDEVFGGYNRYIWAKRLSQSAKYLNPIGRKVLAQALKIPSVDLYDNVFGALKKTVPMIPDIALPGDKIHKLVTVFGEKSLDTIYLKLLSLWEKGVVLGESEESGLTGFAEAQSLQGQERMMFLDTLNYLPNDILTKVDRASMSNSLESRAPFLDHRIIEFAWTIPIEQRIRGGVLKWPLKQLLERYIPKKMFDRPKSGFGIPIEHWLKTDLKDWGNDLLSRDRLNQSGLLDSDLVRKRWEEHLSGKRRWQYHIWNVLIFEAWRDKWGY